MVDTHELSYLPQNEWEPTKYDFNEDAATLLEQAEEKRRAEIMEADDGYNFVPVDKCIEKDQI